MRIVTIDTESYFDEAYSLSKLSNEHYVRDPRFELLGASIKWGADYAARWYNADQFKQIVTNEDWSNTAILCHHTQHDGLILTHHLGVRPKLWLDTLSMARLVLGNHLSVSLEAVRAFYSMPAKRTPYERFKGRHWRDLDEATQRLIADGCCDEVESIWTIFHRLAAVFPAEEYAVVDITMRMFVDPVLGADQDLLAAIWTKEEEGKKAAQQALGVTAKELGSNKTFAALLEAEGIEVAYKRGKNKMIPCFAKTDEFMRELLDDNDPRVSGLAGARLGLKSTLTQTRAETIARMGQRGALAVYLRYCGAHTTRWSGGDGSNFQNFKRGSDLRRAITAPDGWLIVTVDLSQIECRILNMLAGQDDIIERFRRGDDPYLETASAIHNRVITRDDKAERGIGKQAELSCGYGSGWRRFKSTARLGSYGPPVTLTDQDAERAVDIYRATHPKVCQLWREAGNLFPWLNGRLDRDFLSCMRAHDGKLYLPNGTWINYQTLEWHIGDEAYWRFKTRNGWTKMYGAKLTENFVQALARVMFAQACVRIAKSFKPVLSSHDEWSFLIPRDNARNAGQAVAHIVNEMKRVPDWLPRLPLACEATVGDRYAK
jgi:DNA polymerase